MNDRSRVPASLGVGDDGDLPVLRSSMGVETGTAARQSREAALVQAYFIAAWKRPRDWDQVRQSLLRRCRTPAFARSSRTWYRKPVGKGVEGFGIGFVEAALQCMTNVLQFSDLDFEDDLMEVWRVTMVDMDTTLPLSIQFKVTKTVERSKPLDDGTYLSVRRNANGHPVFTVPATDDDLLNKREALRSKVWRTLGLKLLPSDLKEECQAAILKTRLDEAAQDPDGERKAIADAFGQIGVRAAALAQYLGHDLGTCSPAELVDLRGVFGAIRDGEETWAGVLAARLAERVQTDDDVNADDASAGQDQRRSGVARARAALRPRRRPEATPAPTAAPAAAAARQVDDDTGSAVTMQELGQAMRTARTRDDALLVLDLARSLSPAEQDALRIVLESRFPEDEEGIA